MKIEIIRLEQSPEGTLGTLLIDGRLLCVTLELDDRNNQVDRSCIPAGTYACERVLSPRYGDTFEVLDVPGRTDILFHAGNTAVDSKGCILIGKFFGELGGKRAVLDSKKTVGKFMARLAQVDRFKLIIQEVFA